MNTLAIGLFPLLISCEMEPSQGTPIENQKLIQLLSQWEQGQSPELFQEVRNELLNGNVTLLLSTQDADGGSVEYTYIKDQTGVQLTCLFHIENKRILGVFTDERSLFKWSEKPTTYITLSFGEVMTICESYDLDRIVVNTNQPNVFVMERRSIVQ